MYLAAHRWTPGGTLGIILFIAAIACVVIPIVINRRKRR